MDWSAIFNNSVQSAWNDWTNRWFCSILGNSGFGEPCHANVPGNGTGWLLPIVGFVLAIEFFPFLRDLVISIYETLTGQRIRTRITLGEAGSQWISDNDLAALKKSGWADMGSVQQQYDLVYRDENGMETAKAHVERYGFSSD